MKVRSTLWISTYTADGIDANGRYSAVTAAFDSRVALRQFLKVGVPRVTARTYRDGETIETRDVRQLSVSR